MPAYNGKFLARSSNVPSIGSFIPIHERVEEAIQGGTVGEHYHITEAEHTALLSPTALGNKIYEPVMGSAELLLTDSGDCLMAFGGNYAS